MFIKFLKRKPLANKSKYIQELLNRDSWNGNTIPLTTRKRAAGMLGIAFRSGVDLPTETHSTNQDMYFRWITDNGAVLLVVHPVPERYSEILMSYSTNPTVYVHAHFTDNHVFNIVDMVEEIK